MEIEGDDVFGGMVDLTETNPELFTNGLPEWVERAANKGRNVITMREKTDQENVPDNAQAAAAAAGGDIGDGVSVIGSEMTIVVAKKK